MRSKFLLLLLLGSTASAFTSIESDVTTSLKSYLKNIETIFTSNSTNATANPLGSVTMCGVASVNFRTVNATPMLWSDAATWTSFGATKPVTGSAVIIPAGVHIILNENTPNLSSLNISGKLEFADQNINLTAGWIVVMGTLEVGSPLVPFTKKAIITLNGSDMTQSVMGMGTRGIMVMGGILELHGTTPAKTVTKLNNHAAFGATSISLVDAVTWKATDEIVVATTEYYLPGIPWGQGLEQSGISAQKTQLTAAINNSTTATIANGLNSQRWGKLQYLTTTGIALTPGPTPVGMLSGTPTIIDERAEVANLTRNIVIQAPDDILWQNHGFGCHVMIMRMGQTQGVAHLNGVEVKRGGQAGKLGRYPFHWHMLSYQGTETLTDATGQYIRNSVINHSAQRGIVIHGTNGVEIKNNIVYDVRGHGIFTEDASERRNIFDGNLVMKVRNPLPGQHLKMHETSDRFGSAGFWISNPDNVLNNNTATDCIGMGFWLAFPKKTFGESANITPALNPSVMLFGEFNRNVAHSNGLAGIHIDDFEIDEAGNLGGGQYSSLTSGTEPDYQENVVTNIETYELKDYAVWKNNTSGIWNRSTLVANRGAISSGNIGKFYAGAVRIGSVIEKSLAIGQSLNYNMNGVMAPFQTEPRTAFATYNSSIDMSNNVIVNFPITPGRTSGAFAADDYYSKPIDKGHYRNRNNILINSHPGVRVPTPMPSFVFGLIMDPDDHWGGAPNVDNYYSFDRPFFTHGQTPLIVQPGTAASGGVILTGPFYGFVDFYINQKQGDHAQLSVNRLDNNLNTVDTYVVDRGVRGGLLQNMRHFATHPNGIYDLEFQENTMDVDGSPFDISTISDITISITNMLTTNDYQVMAMEYSGTHKIDALYSSIAFNMTRFGSGIYDLMPTVSNAETHVYQPVTNMAAVIAAPQGEVYWQDRVNNKVWFKIRGGLRPNDPSQPLDSDINLFRWFKIRAYGSFNPSILTINFSSFEISKQTESTVRLVLGFETDQENVNFEIQRMVTGGTFATVGKLEDKKSVIGQNQLSFIDASPIIGDNYYRIKAIDINGKISYTAVKLIKISTLSGSAFSIFPNPVTSVLNIKFNCVNAGSVNVLVYNTIGAIVKTEQLFVISGENNLTINLGELSTGVYTIKMVIDGDVQTKKFVKQ